MIIRIVSVVIVLMIAGCGWWFWQDKTTLSEAKVLAHYEKEKGAVLARKPEDLCALRAEDYTGKKISSTGNDSDKQTDCKELAELFAAFDELSQMKGSHQSLKFKYTINKLTFSADRKKATADIHYWLDLGEDFIHIETHNIETLVRRDGKTLLLHSESETKTNFDE